MIAFLQNHISHAIPAVLQSGILSVRPAARPAYFIQTSAQMQPPLSVFLNSRNRNPDAADAARFLQKGKHAFLIIVKIGQIFQHGFYPGAAAIQHFLHNIYQVIPRDILHIPVADDRAEAVR